MPWQPTHDDPLFILAMDHRASFGSSLFGVQDDQPTPAQTAAMAAAKDVTYEGLLAARSSVGSGRVGVLVDERYGQAVVDQAARDEVVLAVPVEASGHDWFTLEWGEDWLDHVRRIEPAYAKVLVRDNPAFASVDRTAQLDRLAAVSAGLDGIGVPLLYELLVPATDEQRESAGGIDGYDRDVRPALVVDVIADNQRAGVEPRLWKVEGLDTVEAAQAVADQARADGRRTDLIVLGRDAPADRLNHWLGIASQVEAFVGFAIGRSIWEEPVRDLQAGSLDAAAASAEVTARYLSFCSAWTAKNSR